MVHGRELHALKAETTNRALNAKLLSSLYEREEHIAVQSLAGTNSLLVTKCVASPLVARNNPASKKSMHGKDADVDKLAVSMGGECFSENTSELLLMYDRRLLSSYTTLRYTKYQNIYKGSAY